MVEPSSRLLCLLVSSLWWTAGTAFPLLLERPALARTTSAKSVAGIRIKLWASSSTRQDDDKKDTDDGDGSVVNANLLQQLDQQFDYEGRMTMTGSTTTDSRDDNNTFRCGFVSIIGAPNMGKSTLLNALLEENLCITTARPQTTRHAILGILSLENCQVCLVDTPGVIGEPAYKLQEGMMEAVMGAFHDADVLLVVTDVFSTPIPDDALFRRVQQSRKPVIVVVNKIDLADRVNVKKSATAERKLSVTPEQAVALWRRLLPDAAAILPVAASRGPDDPGVVALRRVLAGGPDVPAALRGLGRPIAGMFPEGGDAQTVPPLLPISPPLYDTEMLTDRTERFVASEMIREALFSSLKKELPYCCEVQVTEFKEPKQGETRKPVIRIAADIIVERDSQKVIVIGKNGEQIKRVGIAAREKLEDFLQGQVFLDLNVRVNKDWRKKEDKLKAYGYLS